METHRSSIALVILAVLVLAAAAAAEPATPPSGAIALRDALAAALRGNPDLDASAAAIRAGDARTVQAGLIPNPEFRFELENFGGSGNQQDLESAETTLRLIQLVELGGKRMRRRALAALERDAAQWDYEARRATLLADTANDFVDVLARQEQLAIAEELVGVSQAAQQSTDAQVHAGGTAPLDATRARVALGQARLEREQRESQLRAARVALAARWGDATPHFTRADGDLAAVAPPPPTDDLLARIANNPDVARWTTELAARDAAVALEHARAVPDLGIGAGPRYFSDGTDVGVVFELSLPLPFFDRNQGGIAEARALRTQADAERRATELAARSAVATAAEALHAAFERARVLRDELVPSAQQVLDDATAAYRKGAVRYLDVLDARRTVFEVRDQYLEALAGYHHARIDVDRLVGSPADTTESKP